MDLSYIRHNILRLIGLVATSHPEAWVYSWVVVGMAFGLATTTWIGWLIGSALGHPLTGEWAGVAWYTYWFVYTIEPMNAQVQSQIENLRLLKELL